MSRLLNAVVVCSSSMLARSASATPRPLPFTYPYETLAEGELEIEQYIDVTPVKAISVEGGTEAWLNIYRMQTEFEYGITDRLELGLYLQYAPRINESYNAVPSYPEGNGLKQRLRLRLADANEWPVDVSVYGEIVELDTDIELEAKINLQKRLGMARIMLNLTGEREFYFDGRKDWVLAPSGGVTYEITPSIHPGIEYWMNAEFPDGQVGPRPFGNGPHHYVGPAFMFNFGKLWCSTGAYYRLSDTAR